MSEINIDPIFHASLILNWEGTVIYVDPVDEDKKNIFLGKLDPDIVLITDVHHDHFDLDLLNKIIKDKTVIISPSAVVDMLPTELKNKTYIMQNDEVKELLGFKMKAIPMYNLPGVNEQYHTKGRGNGYVVEKGDSRIYISGDTAGIPEMRNLENIDVAFICMNLPYTMDVDEAASAVLDFKPKVIYPYHYRQKPTNDFADVLKFKEVLNIKNPQIKVVQEDWYK